MICGADDTTAAVFRGIAYRSTIDNAMFVVNYMTTIAGVDVARLTHHFTIQAEATFLQWTCVRNSNIDVDSARTTLVSRFHIGYSVILLFSLGTELCYQRWLSTPTAVKANSAARETVTLAKGPRFHIKIGPSRFIRPGISYAMALDKPLTDAKYSIVQLDIPIAF